MSFDNLSGQMLGQYELRDLLGQGGMGAVYRSIQPSLNQEVAIKILPASLAQEPGYLERFNREAQIAANLEHPHIIPTFDYGMQRGVSYVVMRLLRGGTLGQRINQRRGDRQPLCSLGEVSSMLSQLASALDYAHSQGVIHRDIKTNNIMFDNQGNAYLVDFGIAKITDETNSLTRAGTVVGTPSYMPPEQWEDKKLTPAADQYALAVVIYLLVSGRMPFEADSQPALMRKHLHDMPTPPHVIRSDVPVAVQTVLERALAKQPEDRFPTTTEFAQTFQRAITGYEGKATGFFTFKIQNTSSPRPPLTPSRPSTPQPIIPPLTPPHPPTMIQNSSGSGGNNNRLFWVLGAIIVILIAVIAILVLNPNRGSGVAIAPTPTETTTAAPVLTPTSTATVTDSVVVLPPPTNTSTLTLTLTSSPTWTETIAPSHTSSATVTGSHTPTSTSTATATVTLTATYTATASQTPTLTPVPLSIHAFSASTYHSTADSSLTLTWDTESERTRIDELNTQDIVVQSYDVPAIGSLVVKIPKDAKNLVKYRLVAMGGGKEKTFLVAIHIGVNTPTPTAQQTKIPLLIHAFSVSTSNSTAGSSLTLTWDTESDQVQINEFNSKGGLNRSFNGNTTGSLLVTIPQDAKDLIMYQLVATGGGKQKTYLITVFLSVNAPTPIATMTSTPTRLPSMTPTPIGDSIRFDFDRSVPGVGWSSPEYGDGTTFIWMDRTTATLRLPVKTDHDLKLSIHVFMAMSDPILHSLTLKVNKQTLPLTRTGNIAPAFFTATIPRGILAASPDLVQLEFGISGTIIPSQGDSRTLGIAFDWLTLDPVTVALTTTNTPIPSAAPTPFILYQNDFSDGTPGDLDISGFKIQDFAGDKDYCGQTASNGSGSMFGPNQSDYTLEAPVYIINHGTTHWWIELRVRSDIGWTLGYSLFLEPDGAHLRRADGTVLAERLFEVRNNSTYTLRLTVNKNLIVAYVNNMIVGSEKTDNTYTAGYSGIGGGNINMCIDRLMMRAPDDSNAVAIPNNPDTSLPGRIVFTSRRYINPDIFIMDPSSPGQSLRLTNDSAVDENPVLSPDGKVVAFDSNRDGNFNIYAVQIGRNDAQALTSDNRGGIDPTWSPDGKQIAFSTAGFGAQQIYTVDLGSKAIQVVSIDNSSSDMNPAWSPIDRSIAFESTKGSGHDIYAIFINGLGLRNLTEGKGDNYDPVWSPNGKQIAFTSNRVGGNNYEIYVMDADGSNLRRLTYSPFRDEQPTWSPDGKYIAFVSNQEGNKDIWVMKADGSGSPINLTSDSSSDDYDPDWGAAPNTTVAIAPTSTPAPSATPTPSILYQNDFSDGFLTNLITIAGQFSVQDDGTGNKALVTTAKQSGIRISIGKNWDNYKLSFRYRFEDISASSNFLIWMRRSSTTQYYELVIGNDFYNVWKYVNGSGVDLDDGKHFGGFLSTNQWHTVLVEANDNTLTWKIDNIVVETVDKSHSTGTVGFGTYNFKGKVWIDDLVVWK